MAKTKIQESKLLKALAALEEGVEKGDVLEDADPEGGLSAEGAPLSDGAPRGRGESTKKSRRASASSPFASSSSGGDDDSSSDDDSDESAASAMSARRPPPAKKKKVSKSEPASKKRVRKADPVGDDSSSDDSGSDDSSSGADGSTSKSFREMAEGDETIRKGIIVNQFLEALVDQLSLALHLTHKSIAKSMSSAIAEMEERITTHVSECLAKSLAVEGDFNVRLAKAVAAIGNTLQSDVLERVDGMSDMIKSLANQPVGSPRGKALLSKGEVNQPPWSGSASSGQRDDVSDDETLNQLRELSTDTIGDWLFKKSAANAIDPRIVMAWEADRYNPEALPPPVRKALANDLLK